VQPSDVKDCGWQELRNWFTLIFWEDAEKEIAAAPPEKREALRQLKAAEKERQFLAGLEQGVFQCRGARDHDGVKCMKAATTAAQARKCRPPKESELARSAVIADAGRSSSLSLSSLGLSVR
jgi:hypothetical protein